MPIRDARRTSIASFLLIATILLIYRDRYRRSRGIPRRSLRNISVYLLYYLNTNWSRAAGNFISQHRKTFYITLFLLAWGLIKTQKWTKENFYRWAHSAEMHPHDALPDYPEEEPVKEEQNSNKPSDEVVVVSTQSSHTRTWLQQILASIGFGDHNGTDPSSHSVDAQSDDSSAEDEQAQIHGNSLSKLTRKKNKTRSKDRDERLRANVADARLHDDAEDDAMFAATDERVIAELGIEGLRLLRLFEHTIQGISLEATLSASQKMTYVELQPGETLFRAGNDASDGMYIVVRGSLDIFAEDLPERSGNDQENDSPHSVSHENPHRSILSAFQHVYSRMSRPTSSNNLPAIDTANAFAQNESSNHNANMTNSGLLGRSISSFRTPRRYMCTFQAGQSVGENALLEGTGATRAITAAAGSEGVALLQMDSSLFAWLLDQYPHAVLSFILTTSSRQWRVAYLTLVQYLGIPEALTASQEVWPLPRIEIDEESDGKKASPVHAVPRSTSSLRLAVGEPRKISTIETAASSIVKKRQGEFLFMPGDRADSVYVLLSGEAKAVQRQPKQGTWVPSDYPLHSPPINVQKNRWVYKSNVKKTNRQRSVSDDSNVSPMTTPEHVAAQPPINPDIGDWQCLGYLEPGSIAGGIACFVDIPHRHGIVCQSNCVWAVFPRRRFASIGYASAPANELKSTAVFVEIALLIGRALTPLLRINLGMGLQRMWLRSGDVLFRQQEESDGMYLVIHGRLRAYTQLMQSTETTKQKSQVSSVVASKPGVISNPSIQETNTAMGEPRLRRSTSEVVSHVDTDVSTRMSTVRAIASAEHSHTTPHMSEEEDEPRKNYISPSHNQHSIELGKGTPIQSTFTPDDRQFESNHFSHSLTDTNAEPILDGPRSTGLGRLTEPLIRRIRSLAGKGPSFQHMPRSAGPRKPRSRRASQKMLAKASEAGFRVEIGRGETVGEMSVLLGYAQRENTVICVRDCELVRITPAAFQRLSELYPSVMRQFTGVLARRYLSLVQQLSSGGLGGGPSKPVSAASVGDFTLNAVNIHANQTNHPSNSFYGLSEPSQCSPWEKRPTGQLTALDKTRGTLPEAAVTNNSRKTSSIVTIAVVAAGVQPPSASVISSFTTTLCESLRRFGPVLYVNADVVDRRLGDATASRIGILFERARVGAWLSAEEERHRFIVMQTDAAPTAWSKMAFQHCDLALLVGQAHTDAELSPVERRLVFAPAEGMVFSRHKQSCPYVPRSFCRRELVLLHPDGTSPPKHTRQWLRLRPVSWHHHVRLNDLGDFGRVARFVAGRAIGVVLSGGGSRGLAHLGVLRSFESRGIPIDFIGGTSQGSFMAGAYARSLTSAAVMPAAKILCNRIGSTWGLISSLTLPVISYFSGETFNVMLQQALGDAQIEDLWIKYFCVTTNVTRDQMQVHQTGPLWRYARASMTVVGLLPPMLDTNRDILVDGGYSNNLPVDVMQKLCPAVSTTVAVDVEDKDNSGFEDVTDYGDHISGWRLAGKLLFSWLGIGEQVRIPSSSLITLKLSYISHTMAIRDLLARTKASGDESFVYIQPDVQKFALLDYNKLSEIMTLGYLESESVLDDLLLRSPNHELCEYMAPSERARITAALASYSNARHRPRRQLGDPLPATRIMTNIPTKGNATSHRSLLRTTNIRPSPTATNLVGFLSSQRVKRIGEIQDKNTVKSAHKLTQTRNGLARDATHMVGSHNVSTDRNQSSEGNTNSEHDQAVFENLSDIPNHPETNSYSHIQSNTNTTQELPSLPSISSSLPLSMSTNDE